MGTDQNQAQPVDITNPEEMLKSGPGAVDSSAKTAMRKAHGELAPTTLREPSAEVDDHFNKDLSEGADQLRPSLTGHIDRKYVPKNMEVAADTAEKVPGVAGAAMAFVPGVVEAAAAKPLKTMLAIGGGAAGGAAGGKIADAAGMSPENKKSMQEAGMVVGSTLDAAEKPLQKGFDAAAQFVADEFGHPKYAAAPAEGNPEFGGLRVRRVDQAAEAAKPETAKPTAEANAGATPEANSGITYSTDSLGVRWAQSPDSPAKVTIPKSVGDDPAAIEKYANEKFKLQKDFADSRAAEEAAKPKLEPEPTHHLNPETGAIEPVPAPSEDHTISTRFPTAKKLDPNEDPMNHQLKVSGDLVDPKAAAKHAELFSNYPGVPQSDDPIGSLKQHAVDNLKYLWNSVSPADREANKGWYDGAHQLTKDVADKYGMDHRQVAGVVAAMSPQKDWDMNVSLARRVIDTVKTKADTRATPEMVAKGRDIVAQTGANQKLNELLPVIDGKTYNQLAEIQDPTDRAAARAAWVRLHDETYSPRDFEKINPDGSSDGFRQTKKGANSKVAWGSLNEIGKATSIIEDGSKENISTLLGGQHKVRSFYNNIIDPNSSRGDTTIDTHAVAAAMMSPLSGNSTEVLHNFGVGSGSSAKTGVSGTYPHFQDAYAQAAKELDIEHPRQLQSVVWEKVRKMFPAEFKSPETQQAVAKIWNEVSHGNITADEARERIAAYAESGGKSEPIASAGPNARVDAKASGGPNSGKLPANKLPRAATGAGRGNDSKPSAAVPTGSRASAASAGKVKALDSLGKKKSAPAKKRSLGSN